MKRSYAYILFVLVITVAGCAATMGPSTNMANSLDYVRQHKGEGLRRTIPGNETELMDAAVKHVEEIGFTTIRESHAVLAKSIIKNVDISYAFYFYPSQTSGQTEVEILTASTNPFLKAENLQALQISSFQFFNKQGTAQTEHAVNISPKPPLPPVIKSDIDDLPAAISKPRKNSYAIVIGIENYRQKLPKADFAENDAKLMSEYLTKVMGYPEENVVTLTNDRAALGDFAKYFEQWLSNNVEKEGSVFIYYSGHGAPNPKTGDAYLVPYDGDPSFIDKTGYSLKRMYDALGKLPAREIIVVLDSCFSGAGGRSVIAKGLRPLVINLSSSMIVPKNMTVLTASSGEQVSSTYDEKGHGLFTYFLLKGIKNEDVVKRDGSIALGDLFSYIQPQVERIARKQYNNEQTPQFMGAKKN